MTDKREVRCNSAPGGSARWNTVGKFYPVLEINEVLQEFLTTLDDGQRAWCKMRRFDFWQQDEAEA